MAANSVNRSTSRKALAALLSTALVGTGKPAQAVYAYKASDFKGQSPTVLVTSGHSRRVKEPMGSLKRHVTFRLNIHIFVLYAAGAFTESDAEDAIDLLEKSIADVLADNQVTANWKSIDIASDTEINPSVTIGGYEYQWEIIPVDVNVPMG